MIFRWWVLVFACFADLGLCWFVAVAKLSMYNKTRNRGLAFVSMSSPEEALAALNNLESYVSVRSFVFWVSLGLYANIR